MASSSEASCISDPNFAVICAFLERFANECGITYPPFLELQEMLENVEQVPQELIDLHIKLLRKARKTVFLEKWERALIKYCHTYSNQDGWEIERFGYKKSRLEVKLRVLKALLEGQFDLNSKFKTAVNTIDSSELRSKPIGKDKLGRSYWLQFDSSSNIRVYREDLDEESWTVVAKDRVTLVQLLQELSGNEIPLDMNLLNDDSTSIEVEKPILDTGQSSNSSVKNDEIPFDQNNLKNGDGSAHSATEEEKDPLETDYNIKNGSLNDPLNGVVQDNDNEVKVESEQVSTEGESNKKDERLEEPPIKKHPREDEEEQVVKKIKLSDTAPASDKAEESSLAETSSEVIVSEAIEEKVMFIAGEGSGADCNTGNPDKENQQQSNTNVTDNETVEEQRSTFVNQCPTETGSLETKKSETESKPTPKLWSIDTICGTSVNNSLDVDINQDGDAKAKQKNFSTFSIDSVLEKKDSASGSEPSIVNVPSDSVSVNNQEDNLTKTENIDSSVSVADVSGKNIEVSEECKDTSSVDEPKNINEEAPISGINAEEKQSDIKDEVQTVSVENDTKESVTNQSDLCEAQRPSEEERKCDRDSLQDGSQVKGDLHPSSPARPQSDQMEGITEPKISSEKLAAEPLSERRTQSPEKCSIESSGDIAVSAPVKSVEQPNEGEEPAPASPAKVEVTHPSVDVLDKTSTEPPSSATEEQSVESFSQLPSSSSTDCSAKPAAELPEEIPISTSSESQVKSSAEIIEKPAAADPSPKAASVCAEKSSKENNVETQEEPPVKTEAEPVVETQRELPEKIKTLAEPQAESLPESSAQMTEVSRVESTAEALTEPTEAKVELALKSTAAEAESPAEPKAEFPAETKAEPPAEPTAEIPTEAAAKTQAEFPIELAIKAPAELPGESGAITPVEPPAENLEELPPKTETNLPTVTTAVPPATSEKDPEEPAAPKPEKRTKETLQKASEELPAQLNVDTADNPPSETSEEPSAEPLEKAEKASKIGTNLTPMVQQKSGEEADEIGEEQSDKEENPEDNDTLTNEEADKRPEKRKRGRKKGKLKKGLVPQRVLSRNRNVSMDEPRKSTEDNTSKSASEDGNKSTAEGSKAFTKSAAEADDNDGGGGDDNDGGGGGDDDDKSTAAVSKDSSKPIAAEPKPVQRGRKRGRRGRKRRQEKVQNGGKNVSELVEEDPLAAAKEEQDPLAISNEDKSTGQEQKKSRKRRSTNSVSDDGSNHEEPEESGGKRIKIRGKKTLDAKIRKSVEEKREKSGGGSSSDEGKKEGAEKEDDDEKKNKKRGRPKKSEDGKPYQSREVKLLGNIIDEELPSVRTSRRIAQMKMKEEAERRRMEEERLQLYKDGKDSKKSKKRKKKIDSEDEDEAEDEVSDGGKKEEKKKKKRRKKKDRMNFNELNPWASTSGSSSSANEEEDDSEEDGHEEEEDVLFKSDHEFSPESDVEDPDYKPIKRARTAKVETKDETGVEVAEIDDTACEKCGNKDHPEWILLCDKCDKGWHASCVRPALMVVPEGDWYCPPCEHTVLIVKLQESLAQFDRSQKQRENEELRKKRLAFVGISLDNVLPQSKKEKRERARAEGEEDGGESGSDSESGSGSDSSSSSSDSSSSSSDESSEPVYQLRERRTNITSYRYNEYDELIKSALQDEIEAVKGAGNAGKGKDISNIVDAEADEAGEAPQAGDVEGIVGEKNENAMEGEANNLLPQAEGEVPTSTVMRVKEKRRDRRKDTDDDYEVDTEDDGGDDDFDELDGDEIPSVVPKHSKKKKKKKKSKSLKITSLEFTSDEEDDRNSDSDFKGASSEEESEYSLPSESDSSDGIRRRKKNHDGPVRRSTRARIARYDRDFINDDTDDDAPKRKKSRNIWSSESSDSDRSWGRRRKAGRSRPRAATSKRRSPTKSKSAKSKKKKNKKRVIGSDDDGEYKAKPRNRKVSYGGLESLDEDKVLSRRTRGKKINYVEDMPSDSDDDTATRRSRVPKIVESDDEFDAAKLKEDEEFKEDESEEESEEEEDDVGSEGSNEGFGKTREENGKPKETSEKKKSKKKRSVIPDPDDFSEDDLMEDEELDEFAEELEDLDEEEEEILGEMLEAGDVPVHELKSAVKKAKEGRKLKKAAKEAAELKDKLEAKTPDKTVKKVFTPEKLVKTFPPIPAHLENPSGGPKFPKIGKMKITPTHSELAELAKQQQMQQQLQQQQQHFVMNDFMKDMAGTSLSLGNPNIKNGPEMPVGNPSMSGGLLLKTLQGDPQAIHLNDSNIPPLKDDGTMQHLQNPFPPPYISDPTIVARALAQVPMMVAQPQPSSMLPLHMNNGPPIQQFNTFQDMISPLTRVPQYPSNLPTTVAGLSNPSQSNDPSKLRRKPGPKPGSKNKRKSDEVLSPETLDESSDPPLPQQQMEDFMKGIQDSPSKRKGRGRGKKQLIGEGTPQGKSEVTIATVQAPTQFPPQGLTSESGSVITRMLNTPQGPQAFPGGDPSFAGPRNRPPFRASTPPQFPGTNRPPVNVSAMRLRAPPPGALFHSSHPLDPSPSGGAAINVPPSTRAPPPAQSIPPILPRYPADASLRPPYPSTTSPPRTEGFPGFPANFYGNYPPPPPALAGGEEPLASNAFQGSPYPEQFDETQVSDASNSKSFDEEQGGEFGGLASYFASQREDDLDT